MCIGGCEKSYRVGLYYVQTIVKTFNFIVSYGKNDLDEMALDSWRAEEVTGRARDLELPADLDKLMAGAGK